MTIKQHPTDPFQQRTLQRLFQLFMLSTVIILIGGGVALLWTYQQGHQNGRAAWNAWDAGDVSVNGPPTLSATTVDAIFARVGSPMVGTGKVVEQASRQSNIDDAFAMGVWWTETNDGAAGVGIAYHNPGSVRGSVGYPSGSLGYTIYPSYTAAIVYWFNLLRNNYVNRGLSTVYTIARPYVGTTSYPLWAGKVINLMFNYRGIAPPPASFTPTPRPKPTIDPNIVAANLARKYMQRKLTPLLQSRSASDLSPLPGQGQAQEVSQQDYEAASQSDNPPPLPRTAELIVVLFGLLAALAIAWYAFKLKVPVVDVNTESNQAERARSDSSSLLQSDGETPSTDNLPVLPIDTRVPIHEGFTPSTDDLPVLPTPLPATSEQSPVTDALPRPVIALPSHTDDRTPVAIGAGAGVRPGGLLSRYGQKNNNKTG